MSKHDPFANDVLERLIKSQAEYQRTHGHYIVPLAQRLLDARKALLNVSEATLSDPCWCGEDWWEEHDAHADVRDHAEWCDDARNAVGMEVAA